MRAHRLSAFSAAWLLTLGLALLTGCANTAPKDITQGWTPERIYAEARDESNAGGWDKAIGLYEKLEGRAAGSVLAQQAQINKAYAQYRSNEKPQALATLDRFMRL
ncbi:MAG: tetratricopeptide repeat protein, partial [Betaproteobacteria bacterium]|nr:tetratricopeptide repeat protein [Betaproteobacteria bacterium]